MLLWFRGDGRPWAVEPVSDLHTQPPIGYSLLWDDSFFHQKTIAAMVHTVWCGIVELWNVMELMTQAIQQSWWYQQFIPLWETREENQQLLQFAHSSSVRFRSIPTGPFQTFSLCVSGNNTLAWFLLGRVLSNKNHPGGLKTAADCKITNTMHILRMVKMEKDDLQNINLIEQVVNIVQSSKCFCLHRVSA